MSAAGESREQALGSAGSYGCSSSAAAQARTSAGTRICAPKFCAQCPTADMWNAEYKRGAGSRCKCCSSYRCAAALIRRFYDGLEQLHQH